MSAAAVDFELIVASPPEPWAVDFEANAGQAEGVSAGTSSDAAIARLLFALSGTSAGLSSDTAEAGGLAGQVEGTSAGISVDSGELDFYLEGLVESAGVSLDTGILTARTALAGTSAGASADSGTLAAKAVLQGTSAGVSGDMATAGADAIESIVGTSSGASSDTAIASGVGDMVQPIVGASVGTSLDTLDAPALRAILAGTSAGAALDTALARWAVPLAGTSAGVSADSGALTFSTDVYLSGRYILTLAESRMVVVEKTFYIKRGDRWPAFSARLAKKDGGSLGFGAGDIAGVKFLMTPEQSTQTVVDRAVTLYTVQSNTLSIVYEWDEDDTAKAGKYKAEIEVTFLDGKKVTFPNDSYIQVVVTGDLG